MTLDTLIDLLIEAKGLEQMARKFLSAASLGPQEIIPMAWRSWRAADAAQKSVLEAIRDRC